MSEKLNKIYSFKISEKMLNKMRALSHKIDNWSAWIREQIEKKIKELEQEESNKSEILYCPNCGEIIDKNDIFCGNCGIKLV